MNELKWTAKSPTELGHYWFCDFWNGPRPTEIVEVTKSDGKLWANGVELVFEIKKSNPKQSDAILWNKSVGFFDKGETEKIKHDFWCKIPLPKNPD